MRVCLGFRSEAGITEALGSPIMPSLSKPSKKVGISLVGPLKASEKEGLGLYYFNVSRLRAQCYDCYDSRDSAWSHVLD